MSIEVALIDFPKLQEQIALRLLAQFNVNAHHIDHNEAATRLSVFNLALYYWPEKATEAADRLKQLKAKNGNENVPVVLVTSETGRADAEAVLKPGDAVDILVTPLQPHVVTRKLAKLLGIEKKASPIRLDVAYISPFVDATIDTLKQMAGMACDRTGLSVRMDAVAHGDISGVMGLSGYAEGFVSVTFREALARKIVCRMLQMKLGEETEDDMRDGVGEFMNVVAGAAKAELANSEHAFHLSLPQVIYGGPHAIGQLRGVPVIVIEFTTEGDAFEVMVCLIPH